MYKKQGSNFHTSSAGFTLLELMVAVIILAILAAIAMPMYSNYITKAKARSAQSDLVALSVVMESLYQRNLSYAAPTTNPTTTNAQTQNHAKGWQPAAADTFKYTVEIKDIDSKPGYELIATGEGRNAGCVLTFRSNNYKNIAETSNGCGGLSSW